MPGDSVVIIAKELHLDLMTFMTNVNSREIPLPVASKPWFEPVYLFNVSSQTRSKGVFERFKPLRKTTVLGAKF
jgi:hypothetical protein